MASLSAAQYAEALVTKYEPGMIDDLYAGSVVFNYFNKGREQFVGSEVKFRTKVRRNPSGGFRGATTTRVARPGRHKSQWATVNLKRATFSTSIDRVFMKQTKQKSPEAVLDVLEEDLEDLKIAGSRKLDLAMLGTGDGVVALLDGAHAAGSGVPTGPQAYLQIKDPEGRTFGGARYIEEGAYLVLQPDVAGASVAVIVDTVDWTNERIYLTDPAGGIPALPDGAKIVYGDPDGNSYNNDPDGGLGALFGTSATYLGVNRDTYDAWAPVSVGAVGDNTPFNVVAIQQVLDIPGDVSMGGDDAGPDVLWAHKSAFRSYMAEEVLPKNRFVQVDGIYKSGMKRASWINGDKIIPMEPVSVMPYGDLIGLKRGTWNVWSLGDGLELVTTPGGQRLHEIPGYDEYFLYFGYEGNVGCRKPKQQVRYRGLRISTANLPR